MTNSEDEQIEYAVQPAAADRLDRALAAAIPDLSRNRLKSLIKEGHVRAGEATITDPSYRVKPGERFTVTTPAAIDSPLHPEPIELDIRFEDAALLVLEKPPGMVVHPGAGQPDGTLVNALLHHCGDSLLGIGGVKRPGIVHRLDKDTSGLMVVAKTDDAHRYLARQFEDRSIERAYHALVWGVPVPAVGEIEGNIGRSARDRKMMAVLGSGRGRTALTRYRVLARSDAASLVECRLATGRTHQIRVHLAHLGHPVIGDSTYGRTTPARLSALEPAAAEAVRNLHRQALHARTLGFDHPVTEKRLVFETKLPDDLEYVIECLNLAGFAS